MLVERCWNWPLGSISSTFAPDFCAQTEWEAFFGQRPLANSAQIWQILKTFYLEMFSFHCWWNWISNISLNAVHRQLFAWRKEFGEIDPWWLLLTDHFICNFRCFQLNNLSIIYNPFLVISIVLVFSYGHFFVCDIFYYCKKWGNLYHAAP